MGLHDSIYMKVTCPHGHTQKDAEVQTKDLDSKCRKFKVGDKIKEECMIPMTLDACFICNCNKCQELSYKDNEWARERDIRDVKQGFPIFPHYLWYIRVYIDENDTITSKYRFFYHNWMESEETKNEIKRLIESANEKLDKKEGRYNE